MVAAHISLTLQRQQGQEILSRCLEDAINSLSAEQIYNHPAHNFKLSGDRLRGGCPLHQSHSGSSFVVTISSKLFWCEGCRFGGGPADYRASLKAGRWVKARSRDFVEIVKELAADANVSFPERESSPEEIARAQKWERRRAVLAATQEYCQEALWSDTEAALEARHYLVAERGLTEEEIKLLPIGYYPSAGELKRYLISKGFSDEDWKGTGCIWKDMERYITFLWNDASGRPLTIYGRYFKQHPPEGKPKTIASPGAKTKQSPLYFDRALEARHKEIVLVEGVLDAVLLQAKGDIRVCAYVAASCSGDQIETLRRHRITRVTLCGDPDAGGENGTNSNLLRLIEAGISVYIAPKLPDGLDPDEFLLKYGMEGWKTHIDAAEHGFRWKARRLFESKDTSTDKGKAEILQSAIAFCKAVKNHPDLDVFFWSAVRNSLGMEPEEFRAQLEKLWESSPAEVAELGGGSGNGGDGGDGGNGENHLKMVSLYERIQEVINRQLPDPQQTDALIQLAKVEEVARSDVKAIADELLAESERSVDLKEDSPQFKKLVSFREQQLNLSDIFPPPLAKALLSKADSSRLDPIRLVQNLLPACGAVLGADVRIIAKHGVTQRDHWYEYPIFWTADISPPSSGKSDAQRSCFEPIHEMEKEELKRVADAIKQLAQIEATWKNFTDEQKEENRNTDADPEFFKSEYVDKVRRYLWDEATIESLFKLISKQPEKAGTAWVKDELEGLFKSLDQHKSGNKGNALQQLLTAWGGPLTGTVDRVDETKCFRLSGQTLNISGTAQPAVVTKRLNVRDDPDGLTSRLLPAMSKLPKDFSKWSDVQVELFSCIKGLLQGLEQMQGTFEFSSQAKRRWIHRWEELRRGYEHYLESNPAFAYFLGKQCSYVPRIALLIHCIEHYYQPKSSFDQISLETLERAIILSDYYCGQFRLLQAASLSQDEFPLEGLLFKVWEKVKALGKMSTRDVCHFARRYKWHGKKITAGSALEILTTISQAGFGVFQDKTLYFSQPEGLPPDDRGCVDHVDQMLIKDQQVEPHEGAAFHGNVDHVDQQSDLHEATPTDFTDGVIPSPDVSSTFLSTYCKDQHDQQIAETLTKERLQGVDQAPTFDQHDQQCGYGELIELQQDAPQAAEAVVDAQSAPNTAATIVEPGGEEAVVPAGTPTKVDTPVSQAPAAKTEIGKLAERFKYCNFVQFKALCRTEQIQAIEAAIEMVPLNDRERVQGFWERIRLKFASQ